MTWEYLEHMSFRHTMVLPYIDVKDKHVVELDCGLNTMQPWLRGEATYWANDVVMPEWAKGGTPFWCCGTEYRFFQMKDDEFVKLVEKCDVLFLFGHGGYELDMNEKESRTVSHSAIHLMRKFQPSTVVLESVQRYEPCIQNIVRESGYSVACRFVVDAGENWTHKRVALIAGRDSL